MESDKKTERIIKSSINIRLDTIELSYQNFRNNPYSEEFVLRLRVELRKLRTLISFLNPVLNNEDVKKINKELKDLGRILSEKRDIDIVIDLVQAMAEKEPTLIINFTDLFRYLETKRIEEAHYISGENKLRDYDNMLREIRKSIDKLKINAGHDKIESLESFVTKRFKMKCKKLNKKYKKLDMNNYEHIHKVRKEAKKVRYSAVAFKKILPSKMRRVYKKESRAIQEELGFRTDRYVLIELLTYFKDNVHDKDLKDSFDKLIDYHKH